MKRLSCFLALVALVLSASVASAQQNAYRPPNNPSQYQPTQQPPRTSARPVAGNIAVIDMTRVFKQNARFNAMQASMKADSQGIQTDIDQKKATLQKMSEELRRLNIGTPEYTNLDSEITNRTAKLQAEFQLQQKKMMLREAKMFDSVYTEVERKVEEIALARGLVMVVQYAETKSDPNNPNTVMQNLNKQVVWHNRSIDITNEVINQVNRGGASHGGTANRPTNGTPSRRPYN